MQPANRAGKEGPSQLARFDPGIDLSPAASWASQLLQASPQPNTKGRCGSAPDKRGAQPSRGRPALRLKPFAPARVA